MNLLKLLVTLGVDKTEFDNGINDTVNSAKGLGGAIKNAMKVGAVAIGAAATAVAGLSKQVVASYANYEQLVGGVETLFSSLDGSVSAASTVLENASKAYKTAGLSANDYMQTVTSFSAALVAGLEYDYEEAARISDMAITDMADNANKMGTSMDAIQNAYQGFAKQNYTMLDNLKLGYGGTKTEMERLLSDASKFSGVKYDISNLGDVYQAIHVIQEQMGIMGTTAKEASMTISGSTYAMKASWQNLITGLGSDGADLDGLIKQFVESVQTAASNIVPVIQKSLIGISNLITSMVPMIQDILPTFISDVVPSLMEAGMSLIMALGTGIVENSATLIESAIEVIETFVNGFLENLPEITAVALDAVIAIANGISENLPTLIPAIVGVIGQIVQTLTNPESIETLLKAALQIVLAIGEGIIRSIPVLLENVGAIVVAFGKFIGEKWSDFAEKAG